MAASDEEGTPTVAGWITKKGSQFPYTWRRRYCAYSAGEKKVAYYESEEQFKGGAPAKGSLKLTGLRPDGTQPLGLVFMTDDGRREMRARVSNEDELARWLGVADSVHRSSAEGAAASAA